MKSRVSSSFRFVAKIGGEMLPRLGILTFVGLLFTLAVAPAGAAGEGGAVVRGRVLNAASGDYLKNARVSVEGTTLTALTNDFGEYAIPGVPPGEVRLRVTYPGLTTREVTVTARANETVQQNVTFAAPEEGKVVKLEPLIVAASRETNGKTIAIEEQRFAPNIVDVVSADEFGDVTEGNVGEFMKYLPGVLVDYNAAAARTISVRGLPASTTPVSMDGNRMATASSGSASRTFEFEQVSINNIARVEVTKTTTPDQPADTLGGSVNMISKSAFERAAAQMTYRAYLSVNDTATSLGKSALGPDGNSEHLIKPGFDFSYVNPVSKNFGFVLTGLLSDNYNPQTLSQTNWYPISAGKPSGSPATVTADTPYMGAYRMQTAPQTTQRGSIGLTADWRITPRDLVSVTGQYSSFDNYFYIENYTFDTGLVSTFGPTFTNGAAGKGNFYTSTNFRHKVGSTWQPNFTYHHTGNDWTFDAGAYYSRSSNRYRDIDDGFFNGVTSGVTGATVTFSDLSRDRPGTIQVVKNGAALDPFLLANQLVITTPTSINNSGYQGQVNSNQSRAVDQFRGAHANYRRVFSWRVPVSVKVGFDYRQNVRDIRTAAPVWRYNGPDGVYNSGDEAATPFLDGTFSGTTPPYGFTNVQWLDPRKMYQLFLAHPEQFTEQFNGAYGTIQRAVNGSQYIDESILAGYARVDVKLFRDRLWLVAGVRHERTEDSGEGPFKDTNAIYQRDASGKLVLGSNGKPILITTDPTQQTRLQFIDRGSHVASSYGSFYPSANATWNLTNNLIARVGYARTIGRPDFGTIIPSVVTPDLGGSSLLITVNNPALKPWQANNYDLSLEYYFQQAGMVSLGAFRKDFSNFFGAVTTPATPALLAEYGLDPTLFQGYNFVTKDNVGNAQVTGMEFNYSQQLNFLPNWARGVSVFANGTALHLAGPTTSDFSAFVPRFASWGVSLNRPRYSLMLKWVYRSDQRLLLRTGTGVPVADYQWLQGTLKLDVNAEYRISKGLSLFLNARNITDEKYILLYAGQGTPSYARQYNTQDFGVQYAVGVKGTF
jgi:iron complex outermembrane recepter protein